MNLLFLIDSLLALLPHPAQLLVSLPGMTPKRLNRSKEIADSSSRTKIRSVDEKMHSLSLIKEFMGVLMSAPLGVRSTFLDKSKVHRGVCSVLDPTMLPGSLRVAHEDYYHLPCFLVPGICSSEHTLYRHHNFE